MEFFLSEVTTSCFVMNGSSFSFTLTERVKKPMSCLSVFDLFVGLAPMKILSRKTTDSLKNNLSPDIQKGGRSKPCWSGWKKNILR